MERLKGWYVPMVVVATGLASLSGVFLMKATLSGFNFGFPITILLMQLSVTVLLTNILRFAGVMEITKKSLLDLGYLFIPATCLILNVTIGLYALKMVNIPMFSAFRRLSAINVMALEYFVLGKVESNRVMGAVLVMIFGSFVAALGDVTFDLTGYVLVFLNNFVTGANLVYIKKAQQVTGLKALSLFYYINLFALPLCFILALVSGEMYSAYSDFLTRPALHTPAFMLALLASAISAFMINYTTNLCTQVTSALTTSITGQTKNILQTLLGFFAWGYQFSSLNLVGLLFASVGSVLFAWVKYTEKQADAAKLDAKAEDNPEATEDDSMEKDVTDVKVDLNMSQVSTEPISDEELEEETPRISPLLRAR